MSTLWYECQVQVSHGTLGGRITFLQMMGHATLEVPGLAVTPSADTKGGKIVEKKQPTYAVTHTESGKCIIEPAWPSLGRAKKVLLALGKLDYDWEIKENDAWTQGYPRERELMIHLLDEGISFIKAKVATGRAKKHELPLRRDS